MISDYERRKKTMKRGRVLGRHTFMTIFVARQIYELVIKFGKGKC